MAKSIKYVSSVTSTTGAGTFADPYASVAAALADIAVDQTWQIRVLQGHVEPANSPWWLGNGTPPTTNSTDYCEIVAASSVDGFILDPSNPAARIAMKQPSEIDHAISVCGFDFDGTSNAYFNIQRIDTKSSYLVENCKFTLSGKYFSSSVNGSTLFHLKNCDLVINGSVIIPEGRRVHIESSSIAQLAPGTPANLFISNSGRAVNVLCEDVDCSAFAAGELTIIGTSSETCVSMRRCRLPNGVALFSAIASITAVLELIDCTVGGASKANGIHSRYGSLEVNASTYLSGGAGNSIFYTPTAPGVPTVHPMEWDIYGTVVDLSAGAKTLTVEVISDGGINEDALVIEYEYVDSTGVGYNVESSAKRFTYLTPIALAASSKLTSDWTGVPVGWVSPSTQKVSFTIPQNTNAASVLLGLKAYVAGNKQFAISSDVSVV